MADQYVATDTRTGLEVKVTGTFPADPEDRVRIARTCTLFTHGRELNIHGLSF